MRFLPLLLFAASAAAQQPLQIRLAAIAAQAHGKVSIACALPGTDLDCDVNPHAHAPMQSVFKLPLGLAILLAVDRGQFTLDQPVRFLAADRILGSYSPLTDQYPDADVNLPLRTILTATIGQSDNAGSEILLRLLGGPASLQAAMDALNLPAIHVVSGERAMQRDDTEQYRNYAEPAAFVALLRRLADDSPLKPATAAFLNDVMTQASTGAARIRAGLPAGTVLAHKTGTSGSSDGLTPATNDVGLITLPAAPGRPARRLALAIFVTDAHVQTPQAEAVIASLTQTVYAAALAAEAVRK